MKELRDLTRLTLDPGEKKTVTFRLPQDKLAFWNAQMQRVVEPPGQFDAMVGSSSADIRLKGSFTVEGEGGRPYPACDGPSLPERHLTPGPSPQAEVCVYRHLCQTMWDLSRGLRRVTTNIFAFKRILARASGAMGGEQFGPAFGAINHAATWSKEAITKQVQAERGERQRLRLTLADETPAPRDTSEASGGPKIVRDPVAAACSSCKPPTYGSVHRITESWSFTKTFFPAKTGNA
jgi:hypothetical protein